jgi:hypothetical protein
MHKNTTWLALLVTLSLIVLWYSGKFLYLYYDYTVLSARTPAVAMQWSVEPHTNEEYFLKADYVFKASDKEYKGESVLKDHGFWNNYAAQQAIGDYSKKKWGVWYNPRNPDHSSLQKNFPLKECVSAAIMWAIVFYFLWLGYYASRFRH